VASITIEGIRSCTRSCKSFSRFMRDVLKILLPLFANWRMGRPQNRTSQKTCQIFLS